MNKIFLKIFTVLMLSIAIIACNLRGPAMQYASTATSKLLTVECHNTVWDRMADNFTFKPHQNHPRVQQFIKQYNRENFAKLIKFSEHASPYLYHVVELIEEQGLPPELALLPIIESEYMPTATSNRGASGIWQLAALTGKLYGLKQDQWYDGRKDIDASSKVALKYLQYLYEKFDGDWLLALAAYNCGDARVMSAIRTNKRLGKPTDYWSLKLPQETMYFVPKFLSLVYLIKNHRDLEINLAAIPNKPYFSFVTLNNQINLQRVATLAEIDIKEVKKLNPALRTQTTHPKGPHKILLPVKHVDVFHTNMAYQTKKTPINKTKQKTNATKITAHTTVHTVNRGDTLNFIANKYNTSVKAIMHKNKLKSDIIISGQRLSI